MSVALVRTPPARPETFARTVREVNRTYLLRARDVALIDPKQAEVLFGLPAAFVDWLTSAEIADLDPLLDATVVMFTCRLPETALTHLGRGRHGPLHAALTVLGGG